MNYYNKLTLKDLCVFTIANYPGKVLKIPNELVLRLYLGIQNSELMNTITRCDVKRCRLHKPCYRHRDFRCPAYTAGHQRCKIRVFNENERCGTHRIRPNETHCTYRKKYSREGLSCNRPRHSAQLCWEHYIENRCTAMLSNNELCLRYTYNSRICKFHHTAPQPDRNINVKCIVYNCPYYVPNSDVHTKCFNHRASWKPEQHYDDIHGYLSDLESNHVV